MKVTVWTDFPIMLSTELPVYSSLESLPSRKMAGVICVTAAMTLFISSVLSPSSQHGQSMHVQLPGRADDIASAIIISRLFLSAGLTNDCLVASSNELATRYNDRSVLENHHCCTFSR